MSHYSLLAYRSSLTSIDVWARGSAIRARHRTASWPLLGRPEYETALPPCRLSESATGRFSKLGSWCSESRGAIFFLCCKDRKERKGNRPGLGADGRRWRITPPRRSECLAAGTSLQHCSAAGGFANQQSSLSDNLDGQASSADRYASWQATVT